MPQKPVVTRAPVGFFGKLPAVGDFVQRNLEVGFVDKWDRWLQNGLYAAENEMLESWPDIYLTSPIWRFILSPGVVGEESYAGVMLPSIDSTGRYFPLTVVTQVSQACVGRVWSADANDWFVAIETLLLSALEKSLPLDHFCEQIQMLPALWASTEQGQPSNPEPFVCIELDHVYAAPAVFAGMWLEQSMTNQQAKTFWWSPGSDLVAPALLVSRDLPDSKHFSALFNGQWKTHRWALESWKKTTPAPVRLEGEGTVTIDEPTNHSAELEKLLVQPGTVDPTPRSVGLTHPGNVRHVNQDALIELTGAGVWVVADGMGGHLDGERASRLIVDAVAWVTPRLGLEATVEEMSLRLASVNKLLVDERHGDQGDASICGSTVVALVIKKNFFSAIWAGDSRLYLLREGVLRAITQDHSLHEHDEEGARNIITRAVGAAEHLELDVITERLQIGDRLLLCSDGLYNELSMEEITAALILEDLDQALSTLSQSALAKSARDNLTAVLVDYN